MLVDLLLKPPSQSPKDLKEVSNRHLEIIFSEVLDTKTSQPYLPSEFYFSFKISQGQQVL